VADSLADFDRRLEVFFGKTSDAVAYVYARLPNVSDGDYQLRGQLTGPVCRYAETLPARSQLVDRGAGASLLAAAAVPEPCFWAPEMPHLYEVEVELRRGGRIVATARRTFGFRNLGAAGGKLIYDAKRWVLRAVAADHVPHCNLEDWREASAAMLVRSPSDALCDEASQIGVLLVAEIAPDIDELRRLGRWPAVGLVVPPRGESLPVEAEEVRHNLLVAERIATGAMVTRSAGTSVAIVELEGVASASIEIAQRPAALIARRVNGSFASVVEARAACDVLQRELAGKADWSGYIV
jgi:hypothetical protein